jgi:nitroreductase
MLSAHARGLGTCWVGSPLLWLRTEDVKAELQVPAALTLNVAMCLGYANTVPPTSERDRPPVIWVSSMKKLALNRKLRVTFAPNLCSKKAS